MAARGIWTSTGIVIGRKGDRDDGSENQCAWNRNAGGVLHPGEYATGRRIDPTAPNVEKAVHWLVSVQGNDGGWGQDGGETSYVRTGEHLESNGNDVANTAVATLALVHAGNSPVKGEYRPRCGAAWSSSCEAWRTARTMACR